MKTIDEAINILKSDNDYNKSIGCDTSYEEQIAEWLEELKALKENSNGYSKEDIELNRKAMYNKAIDDFASKLIMHFSDWELSNAPFNDDETDGIGEIICETIENAIGGVKEIAEQLKAVE